MNGLTLLSQGWNWNPVVLLSLGGAAIVYQLVIGRRGHWGCFAAALALVAFVLLSPLNLLATGVLFSAHMLQHIVLLLFVPGLVLLSLPADFGQTLARTPTVRKMLPVTGWMLGVGAMWFWHVPQLCDAAAGSASIHAVQTVSLLGMGTVFWWPILAPNPAARLNPGHGIIYLFTACLACTALGIMLTLTPVQVCPIFSSPTHVASVWANLRTELTAHRDQQIGGLLMWLPMCLVYVAAIVLELARWLGEPAPALTTAHDSRA